MARSTMTEQEAMQPAKFRFRNVYLKGKMHEFFKNERRVRLYDGEVYILPEHIVQQLENNVFPEYEIQGEANQAGTIRRTDRPRFSIVRLPLTDEEKRAYNAKTGMIVKEKAPEAAAEETREDIMSDLNKPKTEMQKKIAAEAKKERKKRQPKTPVSTADHKEAGDKAEQE